VFYELLTGRPPFTSPSEGELVFEIINTEQDRPSKLRDDVPEGVEAVVTRMLEKGPELRYQSCGEVLADLRAIRIELETSTVGSTSVLEKYQTRSKRRSLTAVAAGVFAIIVLAAAYLLFFTPEPPVLAVLPFENLNPPEDEWFADGISEEIMNLLSGLGIPVLARTSTFQYKGRDATTQQICEELGADYILSATIRWQQVYEGDEGSSTVELRPELIRGSNATRVWSDTYEENYRNIFQVQARIAEEIAGALGITIAESDRARLEKRPTNNMQAYEAYLRGSECSGYVEEERSLKVQMFQRAVDLDPGFALAYARLAAAHGLLHHFGDDLSRERQLLASAAAERALELAPESPDVHLSVGFYYYRYRDYEKALEEYAIAELGLPDKTGIFNAQAYVLRRLGRLEEALDLQLKAIGLNPLSDGKAYEIGNTYFSLRQYREAEKYYDRVIELNPDSFIPHLGKVELCYAWKRSTELARAIFNNMPPVIDYPDYFYYRFKLELYEGNYQKAIDDLASCPDDCLESMQYYYPKELLCALAYRFSGNQEFARASFEKARLFLEEEKAERPDDHRIRSPLGLTYAGLGRKDDAIREGESALHVFLEQWNDVWTVRIWEAELAKILVMVGEYDAAIARIPAIGAHT